MVRPGNILFELDGVPESVARESLRLAATKLPIRTKFMSRHHASAPTTAEKAEMDPQVSDHQPADRARRLIHFSR